MNKIGGEVTEVNDVNESKQHLVDVLDG